MNRADGFDWSLVRSFLAVCEHGTLLGAARAVGASQPTVGRHVAELERQLGIPLFERTGRGLVVTPRARRLLAAARAMDDGASALWRLSTGEETAVRGTVRLTASQPVACVLLPPLLARMRDVLPEVQVELVVTNAVSNLLRREADVALRMVRPRQSSLVVRRVGSVQIVACAHESYLRRAGMPARAADLQDHALIGGDRDLAVQRGLEAFGIALDRVRFPLRSDDLLAQWAAVRAGLGIGFVARYVLRSDPGIVQVLPSLALPQLPVWLTVHREIRSSPRIRAVWDFLAAEVGRALNA